MCLRVPSNISPCFPALSLITYMYFLKCDGELYNFTSQKFFLNRMAMNDYDDFSDIDDFEDHMPDKDMQGKTISDF